MVWSEVWYAVSLALLTVVAIHEGTHCNFAIDGELPGKGIMLTGCSSVNQELAGLCWLQLYVVLGSWGI